MEWVTNYLLWLQTSLEDVTSYDIMTFIKTESVEGNAINKSTTNFWDTLGKHGNKLVVHSYSEEKNVIFFKPKEKCQL